MCTNTELFGLVSWYGIWIVIGILACLFVFDRLCAFHKITADANRFYYLLGIIAIALGFVCAGVVQATYNYIDEVRSGVANPKWEWGGITFMGGMYGGVLTFVIGSLIFAKGNNRAQFAQVTEIAVTCIPIAHAFGRLGCFAAGCCYGRVADPNDAFYFLAVTFKHNSGAGVPRYPTQIFESVFLFILSGVMLYLVIKDKKINLIVYFITYGIFRFCLEFLRDDPRGSVGLNELSPSQILSIVSVVIGLLLIAYKIVAKKKPEVARKIMHFFKLDIEFVPETAVSGNGTDSSSESDVKAAVPADKREGRGKTDENDDDSNDIL